MRKRFIIPSLFAILLSVRPPFASADDKSQDFEDLPTVSRILETARDTARQVDEKPVSAAPKTMPGIAPLVATLERIAAPRTLGSVFGPFQPRVTQSQPYSDALNLLDPIRLLPEETQKPLMQQWKEITTIRGDLLKEAVALDQKDSKLFDDGQAINRETAALQARLDAYSPEQQFGSGQSPPLADSTDLSLRSPSTMTPRALRTPA